ncbi:MAG: hypothetical protein ACT4NL_10730, partial [Pseudomarimonas sp.]
MTRLLSVLSGLLFLLLANSVDARRWSVHESGALLPAPAGLKSQAFCQANPQTLLVFTDRLTLTPAAVQVP